MPVTASAKKALRNAEAKQARNTLVKAELKRVLKNATPETLSKVVSYVDKAAKRDLIHPNKAARIKSRLARIFSGDATAMPKTLKKSASKSSKATATKAKAAKKVAATKKKA